MKGKPPCNDTHTVSVHKRSAEKLTAKDPTQTTFTATPATPKICKPGLLLQTSRSTSVYVRDTTLIQGHAHKRQTPVTRANIIGPIRAVHERTSRLTNNCLAHTPRKRTLGMYATVVYILSCTPTHHKHTLFMQSRGFVNRHWHTRITTIANIPLQE